MSDDHIRVVASASELLEIGVEIEGVQFYRLLAELKEDAAAADEPPPAEVQPAYGLKVHHEGREVGIRVSVRIELPYGRLLADAAVNYVAAQDVALDEEVRLDFANNVGVMAALPYLRQAIADLSQRVFGEVILMPVIQRGALWFTRGDADEGGDSE